MSQSFPLFILDLTDLMSTDSGDATDCPRQCFFSSSSLTPVCGAVILDKIGLLRWWESKVVDELLLFSGSLNLIDMQKS